FTVPARDQAGEWIVKIPVTGYDGLAENEYSVLEWARVSGFDVPECRLATRDEMGSLGQYMAEGVNAFAIRRYDRVDGTRIHQEDFNQVLGKQPRFDGEEKYEFTYEEMAMLLYAIVGSHALDEAVRRVVFVVASGNNDAHLKNWS